MVFVRVLAKPITFRYLSLILILYGSLSASIVAEKNCVVLAANVFNNVGTVDLFHTLLSDLEGMLQAAGFSTGLCIYEDNSRDGTDVRVSQWNQSRRGTPFTRILSDKTPPTATERVSRIAVVRSRLLNLIHEVLAEMQNCSGRYILFFNDVVFEPSDVHKMVLDGIRQNFDMLCAVDVYRGFYDRWVTRDASGLIPSRWASVFFTGKTGSRIRNKDATEWRTDFWPSRACWNGAVLVNAESAPRSFRSARNDECYASECKLFVDDLLKERGGQARVAVRLDTLVAYDVIHLLLHKFVIRTYASHIAAFQSLGELIVKAKHRYQAERVLQSDPCPKLPMLCC